VIDPELFPSILWKWISDNSSDVSILIINEQPSSRFPEQASPELV
jgi:hypothetical protein